jgi:hypothetical protein
MGTFFDAWGPAMAYVLGYWLADGNMYSQPSCGGYTVSIGSKDRAHLTLLRDAIGLGRISPITGSEVHKLVICRKAVYESLARLGGSERKSLTLAWPYVPGEQLPHLVRGYVDGDGCLTWHRTGTSVRPMLTVVGTLAIIQGLCDEVQAVTGIPAPIAHPNSPGKAHIRVAKWYGVHAKCLAIWLYHWFPGLALARKALLRTNSHTGSRRCFVRGG